MKPAVDRAEWERALRALREQARESGADQLRPRDIQALIQKVRRERRRPVSSEPFAP